MEQQIAKRAKEYARGLYPDMRDWERPAYSDCRRDYAHGAREQRKIDVDKAYQWLKRNTPICLMAEEKDAFLEDFKIAMNNE